MRAVLALLTLAAAPLAAQPSAVFRLQPARPVAELRAEAAKQHPPAESGDFVPADLIDLATLDPTIRFDIRYASSDNFLSTPVYTQARAFLQRPAAEALKRAHQSLKSEGYGLLIHDAYRPWSITWIFWEATPPHQRDYVANPQRGSRHNRGCAVDLTLYELKSGKPVEMPSLYDEMTERSWPDYPGGSAEARRLRALLRDAMEREGFTVYEYEWWHFDYKDWRRYRIGNAPFESIPLAR